MSQEIAALHATISIKTQGEQQAAAAMNRVTEAQKAMEKAAASTSAQTQELGAKLGDLMGEYEALTQRLQVAQSVLQSQGRSAQDLAKNVRELGTAAVKATNDFAAMQAEMQQIEKTISNLSGDAQRAAVNRYAELETLLPSVAQKTLKLNEELERERILLDAVQGRGLIRVNAQMERYIGQIDKAEKGTQQFTKATAMNRTGMNSMISSFMSGRVSAGLLSQGVMSAAAAFPPLAAAIIAATVALTVFIGVATKVMSKILGIADALNTIPQAARNTAAALGAIQGGNLTEVAQAIDVVSTRLESAGSNKANLLAKNLTELAETFALLKPGTGDLPQTITDLGRAFETLNFESLRDVGAPVTQLQNELKALGDVSDNVARDFASNFLAVWAQSPEVMREAAAAAEAESKSFAGLGESIKGIWESIANNEFVMTAVQELVVALKSLFVALQPLIAGFGYLLVAAIKGFTKVAIAAVKVIEDLARGLAGFLDAISLEGSHLDGMANTVRDWADEMAAATEGTFEFNQEIKNTPYDLEEVNDAITETVDRVKQFRDAVSGGLGVVGSLRNAASALRDFQTEATHTNALTYLESLDSAMGQLAEHGTASLSALREQLGRLNQAGYIDDTQYRMLAEQFAAVERAAAPLMEEVKRVERAYGDNKSAAEKAASAMNTQMTPSLSGVGSMADTVAGQVAGLTGQVQTLQAAMAAGAHMNISVSGGIPTMGAVGGGTRIIRVGGGGGPRRITYGRPPRRPTTTRRTGTYRSTYSEGNRPRTVTRGNRNIISPEARNAVNRRTGGIRVGQSGLEGIFPYLPPASGGGGGGGGGGGRANPLANLKKVQELFRQINIAIAQGIQQQTGFNVAGSPIPIKDFITTKGGTTIGTVNIKGVWDFADPAAKRAIIRELEGTLNKLKREK